MALSREGDRRENVLVRQGKGTFQLASDGHEAMAAIAPHLEDADYLFPAYRDRALMHARGVTIEELALDFFARGASSSGGRNLPGHFSCRRRNVFSITSPVGAQCLPAVGTAWAQRDEARGAITTCHIGDAATRQGEFFEAVAFAIQERLPVVFVVEDNGFGISTPTRDTNVKALGMVPPSVLVEVDGRDAETVFQQSGAAVARARANEGPTVLWCELDRLGSHTNADDHRTYRSDDDLGRLATGDPIARLAARLTAEGTLTDARWARLQETIADEVAQAYRQAENEPVASPSTTSYHLFGSTTPNYPTRHAAETSGGTTMLDAVRGVLRAGLAANPQVRIFGEDVEDPKGGVFGLTKGLSRDFPERVQNSPLAEATIVGTAVGMAAKGLRPVFELQFVDFVGPAFNQLISQVANLRWRTRGEWSCPMVLYAPSGAYLPGGGMWHSQTNEGLLAGIPGLRVAVPSNPEDAAGLFWAAMHDDDPSFILLPKHLLRADFPRVEAPSAVPFGRARLIRRGGDATVVAWGNGVALAEAAADRLAAQGVRVDVLDPRTLVPFDWDAVSESVAKTGRLVVVQEDTRTGGFGAVVVSEVVTHAERFRALVAPPELVSRPDVPVPFNASLELAVLPAIEDVVQAVWRTLKSPQAAPLSPHAVVETRADKGGEGEGSPSPALLTLLTVPQLGEGLRRVKVLAHLKRAGEPVALDEPVYEVETDKATVVVESPVAGVLHEWLVPVGEEVDVYGAIANLSESALQGGVLQSAVCPLSDTTTEADYESLPFSERQLALNRCAQNGRAEGPLPAMVRKRLRRDLIDAARAGLRERHPGEKTTEFGILTYCAARATIDNPKFRSSVVPGGGGARRYAHVDLGFAVALPDDELTTAVVRQADTLSFGEFQAQMRKGHRRAKRGEVQTDARTTLLVSSLAGHDVVDAAPILVAPAVAVLFLGVDADGDVNLSLTFDHRLINGVGAARFLQGVEDELRRLIREG